MIKTAIIDSNIQGFMYINTLLKNDPNIDYIFFHDTRISSLNENEKLFRRLKKCIRFLKSKGVTTIIITDCKVCSLVLDKLKQEFIDIQFIDWISLFAKNIVLLNKKRILVCTDEMTAIQCRFKREIRNLDRTILVEQKSLSPLENLLLEIKNLSFVKSYLDSSLYCYKGKIDLVLLGNSAYSEYKELFLQFFGCEVEDGSHILESAWFYSSAQQYDFTTVDINQAKVQIQKRFKKDIIIDEIKLD